MPQHDRTSFLRRTFRAGSLFESGAEFFKDSFVTLGTQYLAGVVSPVLPSFGTDA
jgi:hypothetical protein